jgi:hypothetical protein
VIGRDRVHHSTLGPDPSTEAYWNTQSTTTIVDMGGGNLFAAFNDSRTYAVICGSCFTSYAWSDNSGLSWTHVDSLWAADSPDTHGDGGSPVAAFDTTTGALYLATISNLNTSSPFPGSRVQIDRFRTHLCRADQ